MASIKFENVIKSYGDVNIIKGLDLEIRDKEFMVLVGPSGCGKSTTLRMIAGLEEITDGKLYIGDRVVNTVHPKDRDVAMVFQSYALYPHMTVYENIAFGLRLRKMAKDEIDRLVTEAADTLGLAQLLDRKPKALSGGQRQRVALGRAIVRKPSVFLFDEPLSNLDAELRVQMRAEIANLQKRLGITSVYVTHDQVEAMTMGDRIAVLHDGNLRQVGTPLDLYDTPANVFVAQFIGTPNMNIIKMKVSDDGKTLSHTDVTIAAPAFWKAGIEARKGKEVYVGFRPEHVRDAAEHEWKNTASIAGKVTIIETLGHEVVVHMTMSSEKKPFIAKMDVHRTPQLGNNLELHINTDKLHLFDGETDQRL
ncbi:MAG: multiple sugar transport system ATP-binding protein [Reinekea sp.]|jgi:multiple sugar transport system ATP-binding protein|uniref:Glycerol-3-phosphate ABC transporter, ATP-binding protein UgpC n=1 Tax=Reinekea forsetii TaxID=1336806 RepID=A0A2K8KRQ0_9GAMM|nr:MULTISPECIES: sn-glycerol-3-phosphate ABC transporter ATP-binding protein UgpC [Reinekea]ATX77405.1 glycerol-3-phosphate ABC transporter, ATP-binding protein UgpC [Reinekea forsetii]MDO7640432.1 sn-glycerol-3-phosphate ABC transporter ATP-binding protein UgpC [Reinekea forsetii]MDO7644377.1 sn-glycerol-3-phosphate ABC transporter ATP-binding protein UgpC [Reinekea forsetii]|tara:strand:- start:979 stop:2073 length:1095 start_codon:yes stop_codon:yes gene_type:complete